MANRIAPLKIKSPHIVPSLHTIPSTRFPDVFFVSTIYWKWKLWTLFTNLFHLWIFPATFLVYPTWTQQLVASPQAQRLFWCFGSRLEERWLCCSCLWSGVAFHGVTLFTDIYIYWSYIANIYSTWNHHESWVDSNSPFIGLRWIESGIIAGI